MNLTQVIVLAFLSSVYCATLDTLDTIVGYIKQLYVGKTLDQKYIGFGLSNGNWDIWKIDTMYMNDEGKKLSIGQSSHTTYQFTYDITSKKLLIMFEGSLQFCVGVNGLQARWTELNLPDYDDEPLIQIPAERDYCGEFVYDGDYLVPKAKPDMCFKKKSGGGYEILLSDSCSSKPNIGFFPCEALPCAETLAAAAANLPTTTTTTTTTTTMTTTTAATTTSTTPDSPTTTTSTTTGNPTTTTTDSPTTTSSTTTTDSLTTTTSTAPDSPTTTTSTTSHISTITGSEENTSTETSPVTTTATTTKISTTTPEELYLGIYEQWTHWSVCPVKCKRGQIHQQRQCSFKHFSLDNLPNITCEADEEISVDCLVRDDCKGTGLYLADGGESCHDLCTKKSLICSPELETGDSLDIFRDVMLDVVSDNLYTKWTEPYAPYCIGKTCAGYVNVPETIDCFARPPTEKMNRLCSCKDQSDLGFGGWSPWSECSSTCDGVKERTRVCQRTGNEKPCTGVPIEKRNCGETYCPVHGVLSDWSIWSTCTSSCGEGSQERLRYCSEPKHGGGDCVGELKESRLCNTQRCPVNAAPGPWGEWSGCTRPCGTGKVVRKRQCSRGLFGGRDYCLEPLEEIRSDCNTHICPEVKTNVVLHLAQSFNPHYSNKKSFAFQYLQELIDSQIQAIYEDFPEYFKNFVSCLLNTAHEGSVIVDLDISFNNSNSFQLIYIQESIEVDGNLQKLEILPTGNSFGISNPTVPSAPPSNITLVALDNGTSLHVSWGDVPYHQQNGLIAGYIVFYREQLNPSLPYDDAPVDGTTYSVVIADLNPATSYVIRVLAYTTDGVGIASKQYQLYTSEALPEQAPYSINATAMGPFAAYIEFKGVDRNSMNGIPLGYSITAYSNNVEQFSLDVPFQNNTIILANLVPSTTYLFKICAFNAVGSGPCDQATATTEDTGPSAAPSNVSISDIKTHDRLSISWEHPPMQNIHGDLVGSVVVVREVKTDIGQVEEKTVYRLHPSLTSLGLRGLKPNTEYSFEVSAYNQHGDGVAVKVTGKTCACTEVVSTNYRLVKPYVSQTPAGDLQGVFADIIDDMISFACRSCNRPSGLSTTTLDKKRNGRDGLALKKDITRLLLEVDDFTDLTFPVVGQSASEELMGYKYVSLIEHPGVVLIVKDKSIDSMVKNMIGKAFDIWPLLLLNCLMMVLVGFSIWLLEGYFKQTKETEFSSKLWQGLTEGWYWAFITQGTHGYGDFVPTKVVSRILAIIWIFVGLVFTSLIIGSVVTAVTAVNDASEISIYGSEIGAINASFEERFGILRNGKVNTKEAYTDVQSLSQALKNGDIDGILLDAYTAASHKDHFNDSHIRASALYKYPRTYGFILSGKLQYVHKEVRDFIGANQKRILEIVDNTTSKMEPREQSETKSPFDPESEIWKRTILILPVMLFVLAAVGYNVWYWKGSVCKNRRVQPKTMDIELELKELRSLGDSLVKFCNEYKKTVESTTTKHVNDRPKHLFDKENAMSSSLDAPPKKVMRKPRKKQVIEDELSEEGETKNEDLEKAGTGDDQLSDNNKNQETIVQFSHESIRLI